MATQMPLYYFVKLGGGILDEIEVKATMTIGKIRGKIYADQKHVFDRHLLSKGDLELYAPPNLSRKPRDELHQRVEKCSLGDALDIGDELGEIFTEGLHPKLVHLVIVPQPTVATLRPTTPENKTPVPIEGTPRKRREETQKLVDDFLRGCDASLGQFLAGPPWKNFWKASSSAHHETVTFIDELKIPEINGDPVLLLHDLGKDIVDKDVVNELFGSASRFLVNTSGSGKTRLLYEGLTRHWGFYFTTIVKLENHIFGSTDLMEVIAEYIPKSRLFTAQPDESHDAEKAYQTNYDVAKRRVHQVLTARILVFEHFLKTAQVTCPTRDINEFKMHWLFLQLFPVRILKGEVFATLSDILKDADDEYLMAKPFRVHTKLVGIQDEFNLNKPDESSLNKPDESNLNNKFFFILDEAQVAIEHLHGCFRSKFNVSVKRPVLSPIINTWANSSTFPIIVSGTGLSIDVVNDVIGSAIGRPGKFTLVTKTGAFDDPKSHRKYIMRYMPHRVAQSDSGEEFLRRAWNFARGRHRFTASLLTQLLKFSYQSPHKILNEYVKVFCGFVPSDSLDFVEKEEDVQLPVGAVFPFDFSKIRNDPSLMELICRVLYTWVVERRAISLAGKDKKLVELGFARFVHNPREKLIVDEPLVLLAATYEFRDIAHCSLQDRVLDGLDNRAGRGEHFEAFVAYYLACAFDDKSKLCDIIDFGDIVPEWANQHADLVSVVVKDEGIEVNRFHLPTFTGSTIVIGFNCVKAEEMMNWFKNPTSVLCFPDNHMGPDIVLIIRLPDGQILAIVIQCKWRITATLTRDVVKNAVESVDHEKYYSRGGVGDDLRKDANDAFFNLLRRLNGSKPTIKSEWLKDGVPVLKVIASYPAKAKPVINNGTRVASLNMDRCVEKVDKKGFLDAMKESLGFGTNKRPVESDDAGTSSKKPRR